MSPSGATNSSNDNALTRTSTHSAETLFLPNFCDARMVFAVVLLSELLALIFSLVRPAAAGFLTELARLSVLTLWLGLTSAGWLCLFRGPLRRRSTGAATIAVFVLVTLNILVLSIVIVWIGRWLGADDSLGVFPRELGSFARRNVVVGLIVTGMVLRYLFVTHEWRRYVESEARSRIDALQARIRPHFLFNSMNTIASLTRSDPRRAEVAVEDLADLFRASLSDSERLLTLEKELELSRIYERIESLRLGDRLKVDWDVADLPMQALLPGLTIQPLLENAIYHGIEPLGDGGTVTITGRREGEEIEISVSNPIKPSSADESHRGHRIAMENIRERLRLAFDGRGALEVAQAADRYSVTVRFPVTQ
jgi:two-component system sensor histidine kinase AlgZ